MSGSETGIDEWCGVCLGEHITIKYCVDHAMDTQSGHCTSDKKAKLKEFDNAYGTDGKVLHDMRIRKLKRLLEILANIEHGTGWKSTSEMEIEKMATTEM